MLTFPLVLREGTIKINNKGKYEKVINVYVPNKDSVNVSIPAGQSVDIITKSAGESFMYLAQADDELSVELV